MPSPSLSRQKPPVAWRLAVLLTATCAATPPAPPATQPSAPADPNAPIMLAPTIGLQRRLSDVNRPEHRPTLPPHQADSGRTYFGTFKVCVGPDGAVERATAIASPGQDIAPAWIEKIQTWRHLPLLVEGKPRAFCYPLSLAVAGK